MSARDALLAGRGKSMVNPSTCPGCRYFSPIGNSRNCIRVCNYAYFRGETIAAQIKKNPELKHSGRECSFREQESNRHRARPEYEEEARRLYDAGLCDREIAEKVGVSRNAISNWRFRYQLPCIPDTKPRAYARIVDRATFLKLYSAGHTDAEIAQLIGCSPRTCEKWRHKLGLKINKKKDGMKQ